MLRDFSSYKCQIQTNFYSLENLRAVNVDVRGSCFYWLWKEGRSKRVNRQNYPPSLRWTFCSTSVKFSWLSLLGAILYPQCSATNVFIKSGHQHLLKEHWSTVERIHFNFEWRRLQKFVNRLKCSCDCESLGMANVTWRAKLRNKWLNFCGKSFDVALGIKRRRAFL